MENKRAQAISILVVDDSIETLQIVKETLQKANFYVSIAISGEQALRQLKANGLPHLAIVDLNMPPGINGFELCEQLFQFSDIPVIMLTAVDEVDTMVRAIEQFAEDYVIKPFNPNELVARVRRVVERVGTFPFNVSSPIEVDPHLRVNFPARKIIKEDTATSLTPTEARLLYILMRSSGKTVATDFLLRRMWPRESTYDDRLHVYVHRLRRKLRDVGGQHQYVISERGVGYRFQPRTEAA